MNNKNIARLFAFTVLTLSLSQVVYGQKRVFEVKNDKQFVATVTVTANKSTITVSVQKAGQLEHTYTKDLESGVTTAKVGNDKVFSYNDKSQTVVSGRINKKVTSKTWLKDVNSEYSLSIQNQLLEDMQIFNAIRLSTKCSAIRTFEISFIIATANETPYWIEKPMFSVIEENPSVANLDSDCSEGCDNRLANCLRDVQPNQKIECYRIADACHARCKPSID
jgi:hypothetical protein